MFKGNQEKTKAFRYFSVCLVLFAIGCLILKYYLGKGRMWIGFIVICTSVSFFSMGMDKVEEIKK